MEESELGKLGKSDEKRLYGGYFSGRTGKKNAKRRPETISHAGRQTGDLLFIESVSG
jgi:hypothetical protein